MSSVELDRFLGALVGAGVGDCLGAPFEGRPGPIDVEAVERLIPPGVTLRYTDDTAMTLVLAESLLSCSGLDDDHLASAFGAQFRREPWRGYGGGASELLARMAAGGIDWRTAAAAQFGGTGSYGNGAAMRVAPVGLHAAGNPATAAHLARRSALPTHTHPAALDGAAVQAAAVAELVAVGNPNGFHPVQFLERLAWRAETTDLRRPLELVLDAVRSGSLTAGFVSGKVGSGIRAAEAVPAAVACFACHPASFRRAVLMAIGLGGDTDTVASMTGALSGALVGCAGIPPEWVTAGEGSELLAQLADRLHAQLSP